MSLPPKTDNDESGSEAGETKTRKKSTRTPAVKKVGVRKTGTRTRKAAAEAGAESAAPDTGDLFSTAPAQKAFPPREQAPEPSPRAEREPEAPRSEPAEERREVFVPRPSEPRQERETLPAQESQVPSEQPSQASAPAGTEDSQAPVQGDQGQENSQAQESQEPQQQQDAQSSDDAQGVPTQGGRVIKDRNYWKNLKKEKKKWKQQRQGGAPSGGGEHGGSHGGHSGHGGHGGHHSQPREKYPQQPPPPTYSQPAGDLPDEHHFEDVAVLDNKTAELKSQAQGEPIHLDQLYAGSLPEINAFARLLGIQSEGVPPPRRLLLQKILTAASDAKMLLRDKGWLDLSDAGYGFIVHSRVNYRLYPENTYVPASLVTRYGLKRGHLVEVVAVPQINNERCPSAVSIESVMGLAPGEVAKVVPFEELIPYYPQSRILVEAPEVHVKDVSMRAIDILTPIGFGQRGLIVAPPRTGKTVLLHNIANSISTNYPEACLLILLVDERPEEVTDFKRHTRGEVISSTFDEMPENHVHAAEMVGEKARRLVEMGQHVIILLDSITRLARAYNALAGNSGKIMSGGLEATALQKPKRFFGAARNIEGGGSLTILGTALIDTGSRMDEIIFEEFKGTGNMELHLDRGLSDKRIFPAINIDRSGTRKEELIYHPEELQRIYGLRRAMQGLGAIESMDMLIQRLKKTRTNAEFLIGLSRS